MSSPWGKVNNPEPVNLTEIMSEEVARDLQAKEDRKYEEMLNKAREKEVEIPPEVLEAVAVDDICESDMMIARMLQMQFDKEYDEDLERSERKFNGDSKVSISFQNFKRAPRSFDFQSDSEEEEVEDVADRRDWDRFDTMKRQMDSIPPCGFKMVNGSMITKHDITMNGRRNACKLMSFAPEFKTGDGEDFDMKINNRVFNSLKRHSQHERNRKYKLKDKKEDHATAEFGMDSNTRLDLYKCTQDVLGEVYGAISTGKEAVILHASSNPSYTERPLPAECAVKVYKTTLSEFKQRDKYIKDDHRFKDRLGKQCQRKTVHLWAEKETRNLSRLRNAGIPCPEVVSLRGHVLVMSFIGKDHTPAPKLKDAPLSKAEYIVAYSQVVSAMKKLFRVANLIHADLSEYNILWHEGRCYFIDVSQSVMLYAENAFQFLMRDCTNVTNFFSKKGVPEVATAEELFERITGCSYEDKIALLQLQEAFKMKPHLVDKPGHESGYNFDEAWSKSKGLEEAQLVESPLA